MASARGWEGGMFKEFKDFAIRGNAIDMAVGIIVGASFSTIVNSLVSDVLMPPVGLLFGYDFSNMFLVLKDPLPGGSFSTLAEARKAGAVTLNYGIFINAIVNFIVVSFAMFMLIKSARKVWSSQTPAPPATKDCSFCASKIPARAVRCPHCTSSLT